MSLVIRQVCHCDQCSWEWIARGGKLPEYCPRRECRSRKWGDPQSDDPRVIQHIKPENRTASEIAILAETFAEPEEPKDLCPDCGDQMVPNRILKRLDCACGYHTKPAR